MYLTICILYDTLCSIRRLSKRNTHVQLDFICILYDCMFNYMLSKGNTQLDLCGLSKRKLDLTDEFIRFDSRFKKTILDDLKKTKPNMWADPIRDLKKITVNDPKSKLWPDRTYPVPPQQICRNIFSKQTIKCQPNDSCNN
jgi:hypothetical protein